VVQDVEIDLSSTVLGNKQRAELQEIIDGCRNVLMGIEKAVNSYMVLKHDQGMERNVVKRVWKQLKWEPDDINSLRSRLNSNIVLLSAFNGHITGNNVTKLVKYQDSQEYQAILDWLSPVSAFSTRQNDCKSRREAGTSQWFLDCPGFSAWILKPRQTLFCPGIPGAGKTILISAVVDELYSRFGRNNTNGIAYIYCDFKNLEEQKPEKLLACLLRQLLHGQQAMPHSLRMLYHQHIGMGTRPSLDEISGAIQSVSAKLLRLFIVIDALDECQNSDGSRTAFLDEIFNLQAKSTLNILATSRFIPEITKIFESEPSLEIRASKNDVTKYLRGHMTRLPSFVLRSPELQDEIVLGITETADGRYVIKSYASYND
jgi:Cdc6-like AAA superfamily ATPase